MESILKGWPRAKKSGQAFALLYVAPSQLRRIRDFVPPI
jgi:hypothetical protein